MTSTSSTVSTSSPVLELDSERVPLPTGGAGDLGLSGVFEGESRFLHRDGRFNSRRTGLGIGAYNPYTFLLSLSWPRFFWWSLLMYLALNGSFALLYFALGSSAISPSPAQGLARLAADFFFSVQTFGTIGFGHVYPATTAANLAVTLEAFVGLMAVALVTGMLFARFSRATHRVLFSDTAVIAPYQGGKALMFRVVNGRHTDLMDVEVEVMLTMRRVGTEGVAPSAPGGIPSALARDFKPLTLERSRVVLFPLAWTVVHPLTETSPLWNLSAADILARDAEAIVIFRANDEVTQQPVQARTSYHAREIQWGRKFLPMYVRDAGILAIDAQRLNDTEKVELG